MEADTAKILIDQVRAHPCLYDNTSDLYRCTPAKNFAWKSIAEKIDDTPEQCKKRWRNIRDCYVRHKRIAEERAREGLRTPNKWLYFERLTFLNDFAEGPRAGNRMKFSGSFKEEDITMASSPESNSDLKGFEEEPEIDEFLHIPAQDDAIADEAAGDSTNIQNITDATELLFLSLVRQMKEAGMSRQQIVNISSRVSTIVFSEIEKCLNIEKE